MKLLSIVTVFCALILTGCITSASKAEEYYAMGTAYLELKKYAEAETWFNKAKFNQSVKIASEYNLGRIAYETGRYQEALVYFERILREDEENITALKAAAYTCIKLERFDKAESYYRQILDLVPESYDEGYNYALVLMALGKSEEAEKALVRYNNTENPKALLVLARAQKKQGKPEAADAYSISLLKEDDPEVRIEFAAYLVETGLLAKGLEEYNKALDNKNLTEEQKETIQDTIKQLEADGKSGAKTE